MTRIESLGRGADVWDFEAGYVHEHPLASGVVPDLQEPDGSTNTPETDLFTPPAWPHSY